MSRSSKQVLTLILVFGGVFAMKAALVPLMRSPWILSDETDYAAGARGFWRHGRLILDERGGQPLPPGYSIVISPAFAAPDMKTTYRLVLIINSLLTTLTGLAAYGVVRRLIGSGAASAAWRFALAVGVIVSVMPAVWLYSYVMMSENLFALLLVLLCAVIVRMPAGRWWWWWGLAAGLLTGAMFVTRSIMVVVAPGVVAACPVAGGGLRRAAGRLACAAAGAAAIVVPWVAYVTSTAHRSATGYPEEKYIERLGDVLSSGANFAAFLRIVGNDLTALAVLTGGVFLVAAADAALRRSAWRSAELRALMAFALLATAGVIGLSAIHQFRMYVVEGQSQKAVYSRYAAPLAQCIVMVACVGLWSRWQRRPGWSGWVRPAAVGAVVFGLMFGLMPVPPPKTSNTIGLWHLTRLTKIFSPNESLPWVVPCALYLGWGALAVWAFSRARTAARALGAAGLLFLALSAISVRDIRHVSRSTHQRLPLGPWLLDHARPGDTVFVDDTPFIAASQDAYREVQLAHFWNPDLRIIRDRAEALATPALTYLVSLDDLRYRVLHQQPGRWFLYHVKGDVLPLRTDIAFIQPGLLPDGDTEGFYAAEGTRRWTTDRAVVRLRGLPSGRDVVLSLATGGRRPPDNPAHVEVLFDGRSLGTFTQGSRTASPQFHVPGAWLLGGDVHRLELRTNTFRPRDYPGWPKDGRDLGVFLFWIKIQAAEH